MFGKALKIIAPSLFFRLIDKKQACLAGKPGVLPRHLMVEITNDCNLRCAICGNHSMKVKRGFMDLALFEKVAVQARKIGIQDISLHTIGEPLLHPAIADFIKIAKQNEFRVLLSTNALLLDEVKSRLVLFSGLDNIRYSIEGHDKESYERARVGSNFEQIIRNISEFKKIRDSQKIKTKITINSVLMKNRMSKIREFYKTWERFADEICFTYPGNFNQKIDARLKEEFINSASPRKRLPCSMLWDTMVMQWDGRFSACCMDFNNDLIVGSIIDNELLEIWNSTVYQKLRKSHLEGDYNSFPICKNCDPGNRSTAYELYRLNRQAGKLLRKGH